MPVFIGWALGVLGAAVVAKMIAKEWRRVNAELHPHEPVTEGAAPDKIPTLRRDPQSGVYRAEP